MSDAAAQTVLERKAQAQRQTLGAGAVSVPRALGRSLSIAADALWGLSAICTADREETVPTDRALARMPNDMLYLLLERDGMMAALLAIDRAIVTGMIETQTLGKVTRMPLDTRPFTATDAAMMAPWVDAALPRFSSMLVAQPEQAHLQDYVFGAHLEDTQTAALAMDAETVHVLGFRISLAQDTRAGQAVFMFPEPPRQNDPAAQSRKGKHEAAMKLVPARMHAVLTRIHVPLSRAQALKPGDLLEISPHALKTASLVVDGGHIAAKGKLGQMNGFRAVRIGSSPNTLHQPPVSDAKSDTALPEVPSGTPPAAPLPEGLHPAVPPDLSNLESLSADLEESADPV